jgi:hypothetical protein
LPDGVPAPAGYIRLGSYTVDFDGKGGKKALSMVVVMWQRQ